VPQLIGGVHDGGPHVDHPVAEPGHPYDAGYVRRLAVVDDGPLVGQWQRRFDAGVAVGPLRGLVCLLGVGDAEHRGAGDDGGHSRADERLHDAPPCSRGGSMPSSSASRAACHRRSAASASLAVSAAASAAAQAASSAAQAAASMAFSAAAQAAASAAAQAASSAASS